MELCGNWVRPFRNLGRADAAVTGNVKRWKGGRMVVR
jgi:hypothetical protein